MSDLVAKNLIYDALSNAGYEAAVVQMGTRCVVGFWVATGEVSADLTVLRSETRAIRVVAEGETWAAVEPQVREWVRRGKPAGDLETFAAKTKGKPVVITVKAEKTEEDKRSEWERAEAKIRRDNEPWAEAENSASSPPSSPAKAKKPSESGSTPISEK